MMQKLKRYYLHRMFTNYIHGETRSCARDEGIGKGNSSLSKRKPKKLHTYDEGMTSAEYYMYLADKAIGQKGIKEASGPLITRVFCTDLTIGHRWRDMLLRRGWQAVSMACSLWSIVFTTRLHGQQSRYQTRSSDVGVDVESAARSGFTSGLFQQQMVDTDRRCCTTKHGRWLRRVLVQWQQNGRVGGLAW